MKLEYVNIQKYWRKIRPFADKSKGIWLPDMLEYRATRQMQCLKSSGSLGWSKKVYDYPKDFDSCDWRYKRRNPHFWRYVCHNACHWLVNLNLFLAEQSFPKFEWRVVTSRKHSTCWNGDNLLFDMNFLALDVDVKEAEDLAFRQKDTEILEVGERYHINTWSNVVDDYRNKKITKEKAISLWETAI